jgi:hypothetical protein
MREVGCDAHQQHGRPAGGCRPCVAQQARHQQARGGWRRRVTPPNPLMGVRLPGQPSTLSGLAPLIPCRFAASPLDSSNSLGAGLGLARPPTPSRGQGGTAFYKRGFHISFARNGVYKSIYKRIYNGVYMIYPSWIQVPPTPSRGQGGTVFPQVLPRPPRSPAALAPPRPLCRLLPLLSPSAAPRRFAASSPDSPAMHELAAYVGGIAAEPGGGSPRPSVAFEPGGTSSR